MATDGMQLNGNFSILLLKKAMNGDQEHSQQSIEKHRFDCQGSLSNHSGYNLFYSSYLFAVFSYFLLPLHTIASPHFAVQFLTFSGHIRAMHLKRGQCPFNT